MKDSAMNLIILDRDGVVNYDSDQFIKSPDEWLPIPGSLEAIARLTQSGYLVVIATNQSGLGRGLFDMDALNAIHEKMLKAVSAAGGNIAAFFYCPHTADSDCKCRKPNHGMFNDISDRFNIDLQGVPAIGDSLRDLEAALAAGCQPILVLTGKGEKTSKECSLPPGTLEFADLSAAADHILDGQHT
jgi:D-glycero-D-manno-heptose 1,7-bisphosphate phosphatase